MVTEEEHFERIRRELGDRRRPASSKTYLVLVVCLVVASAAVVAVVAWRLW